MIIIHNKEHFREALKFARKIGGKTKHSFLRSVSSLNRFKKGVDLHIVPDFVKHSFYWWREKEGKQGMNGGMILHGFQETFAVQFEPKNYPQWSIHT